MKKLILISISILITIGLTLLGLTIYKFSSQDYFGQSETVERPANPTGQFFRDDFTWQTVAGGSYDGDFTWATTYNELSAATSSALWLQNDLYASSTAYFSELATFGNASTTVLTVSGTASTTNLVVSSLNAASCDVKSSTAGVFSCGTDATGGGATTITSSADVTDSVIATLTAITGLSFTAAASTNYLIDCYITASSSVITNGMSFGWDTPASPTLILMHGTTQLAAGTVGNLSQRADNVNIGITSAALTAYAPQLVVLHTHFKNGLNAGTMSLGFTPETAAALTVVTGSVCQYRTY